VRTLRGIVAGIIGSALVAAPAAHAKDPAELEEGEVVDVNGVEATWNDEGYEYVLVDTSEGQIYLELDSVSAPVSVKNFLQYVDDGHYDDTIFHRVMSNFVVQGGGFTADMTEKPTRPPIVCEWENGLKNKRGTLAMARTSMPDSATCQFYINVVDNSALDRPRGNPPAAYAVFGRVAEGMDVVDKIRNVAVTNEGAFQNVPVDTVTIFSATRVEDSARLAELRESGYDARRTSGWAAALERAGKRAEAEALARRVNMSEEEQFDEAMAYIRKEFEGDDSVDLTASKKTDSGVWYLELIEGEGDPPSAEDVAMIHYKGFLTDGTKFDDSRKDGNAAPRVFPIKNFIPGFRDALMTMRKGGKSVFVIPGRLAYGPAGRTNIPPNSTLVFQVDLVDYREGASQIQQR
jgi:peptidyl-prolyl cis-trans isomerase A (cyclophilin A)